MGYVYVANSIIRVAAQLIEYVGLIVIVVAVVLALINWAARSRDVEHVRDHLAQRMIFGLEFVIAADILFATITTELTDVFRLGGIVIIRVLLGYVIRKEAVTRFDIQGK